MNIIKWKKLTWVDIKNPAENDVIWLKKNFNLHPLIPKELLPPMDFPKIENFGDYLFIVVFYPFFDKETFQTIPFELDIIVSENYIITSHYKDIVPLKAIFDKCNLYEDFRKELFSEGTNTILYHILREILRAFFPKLTHIKDNIKEIEHAVYKEQNKETVNQISLIKRDIIGFQRILELQKPVFEGLIKENSSFFDKSIIPYFHNLINLHIQADNLLSVNIKTLSTLDSTNQSLLTTKTNDIIKMLTIFSVIVFPLTLIASLFGMNTKFLPFVGRNEDFWIILSIMMIGTIFMLIYFKIKKWF